MRASTRRRTPFAREPCAPRRRRCSPTLPLSAFRRRRSTSGGSRTAAPETAFLQKSPLRTSTATSTPPSSRACKSSTRASFPAPSSSSTTFATPVSSTGTTFSPEHSMPAAISSQTSQSSSTSCRRHTRPSRTRASTGLGVTSATPISRNSKVTRPPDSDEGRRRAGPVQPRPCRRASRGCVEAAVPAPGRRGSARARRCRGRRDVRVLGGTHGGVDSRGVPVPSSRGASKARAASSSSTPFVVSSQEDAALSLTVRFSGSARRFRAARRRRRRRSRGARLHRIAAP
mmetsp:Transcript_3152/g.11297  ORF Transcript_3152/g.11297 Transcript_3152/m.11297 type:complete len:287 (-) Transcript_3152:241-1101(-)